MRDAVVVVSDDRIAYAGSTSDFRAPVPAGAERIELRKVTLLPGLVDAHVHLTLGGSPPSNARATVEAGFTTVQDLGATDAQIFTLRDDINARRAVGPRVLASGRWIGVTGGTCDFGGMGVRGAAAFRERVQEEVHRGANVIKVCVSGWLADARRKPERYEISDDELEAAIDEAHRLKRRVAVHAISAGGIDTAIRTSRWSWPPRSPHGRQDPRPDACSLDLSIYCRRCLLSAARSRKRMFSLCSRICATRSVPVFRSPSAQTLA